MEKLWPTLHLTSLRFMHSSLNVLPQHVLWIYLSDTRDLLVCFGSLSFCMSQFPPDRIYWTGGLTLVSTMLWNRAQFVVDSLTARYPGDLNITTGIYRVIFCFSGLHVNARIGDQPKLRLFKKTSFGICEMFVLNTHCVTCRRCVICPQLRLKY